MSSDNDKDQFETRQLKDVASARTIYTNLKQQDEKRAATRATTRTALEGGKPYNKKKLEKRGELWRCNENFGDAGASRDRAVQPYWDMANNARSYIGTRVHNNANESEVWENILEDNFDLMIEEWDGWIPHYLKMIRDFIDFGIGHPYWKDKNVVRWEAMPVGRVLFQDQTPIDHDKWQVLAIEKEFTVPELMKYVTSSKTMSRARAAGWKPKIIKNLIKQQAHNKSKTFNTFRWEEIQTELISNDIFISQDFPPIECVILLVKQNRMEDGISSWIFPRTSIKAFSAMGEVIKDDDSADGFIFEKKKYADSFNAVLGSMVYEVGQGTIHTVKGFAIKNFAQSAMLNRIKCRLVDSATITQALNFKRSGDKAEDGPPVESYGAVNIFPSNLEEITHVPKTSEGILTAEYIEKGMDENNSTFRDQQSLIQGTETATAAKILAAQAQDVGSSNAALYLAQLGKNLYSEMMRRLMMVNSDPDAVKFKKRCIDGGIPKEMFHKLEITVVAGSHTGRGNPALKSLQWLETFNLLGGVSRINQDWLLENYIADTHGSKAVKKALLPEGRTNDEWAQRAAIIENDVMSNGVELPAIQIDKHIPQLQVHIATLNAIINQFNTTGQGDPDSIVLLNPLIPHIEQHFQWIENDDSVAQVRNQLFGTFSNLKRAAIGMVNTIDGQIKADRQRQQSAAAAQSGAPSPQQRVFPPAPGPKPGSGSPNPQLQLQNNQNQ